MGCQYYCYMDTNTDPPAGLTCAEFHTAYADWKGSAAECDLACFRAAQKRILPRACDNEIDATYTILAEFDGNTATISGADIEDWCTYVKLIPPNSGSDVITAEKFETFWHILQAEVADPACDKQ